MTVLHAEFMVWIEGSGFVSGMRSAVLEAVDISWCQGNCSGASFFPSCALVLVWCGGNRGLQLLIASFALLLARIQQNESLTFIHFLP